MSDHLSPQTEQSSDRAGAPVGQWYMGCLGLLIIGTIFWNARGCMHAEEHIVIPPTATTEVAKVEPPKNATPSAMATVQLPDGVSLQANKDGIEGQLVGFLVDAAKPVDKTTWFNFDRLLFDTGKATLRPESQPQLENIVAILKAFPNAALKLGGYTDNTGNSASNLKLSDARAKSVMTSLVELGADKNRLAAEGYGDQFPVASNDTPEGRAQNRRIAVRVTKK